MKLKELREYAHLTQKQLAEKIGNVQRNISNWENGTSEPDLSTVIKLAEFFNVTTDELLGKEGHLLYFKENDYYSNLFSRSSKGSEIMTYVSMMTEEEHTALLTLHKGAFERS